MNPNETLNQLTQSKNGASRVTIMIGAKNLSKDNDSVMFKFMRGAKNKANYIKITLTPDDLYTVEFGYLRGADYTVRSTTKGLYNDMLYSHFTTETGLALKL